LAVVSEFSCPNPTTILVVEDETFVRDVTSEVLSSFGHRVLPAASAEEAMSLFLKHPEVGLVLTDVVMPGSNGRRLAKELREVSPEVPIIITSGYPDGFMATDSVNESLHYLPKPYSVASLMMNINRIMEECDSPNGTIASPRG
jgi:hypothetical protein